MSCHPNVMTFGEWWAEHGKHQVPRYHNVGPVRVKYPYPQPPGYRLEMWKCPCGATLVCKEYEELT